MLKKINKFPSISLLIFILLATILALLSNSIKHKIIYINAEKINAASLHSTDGYIINQPGTYILDHNINWLTDHPNNFAITIAANNVIIDGKNHYIKQKNPSVKHAIGIQVEKECNNITIKNIIFDTLSGGGIWFRGGNSNLIVKNIKTTNCGYNGLTLLYTNKLTKNSHYECTQGIIFDGSQNMPIKNAQVTDCYFVENGILKDIKQPQYESSCGAIYACAIDNLTIENCTIDGCVGRYKSFGITLINVSNVLVHDVFITDVFSSYHAQSIYTDDVDGKIEDMIESSIISHANENQFCYMLDNHYNFQEPVKKDPTYQIEYNHLKSVIPKHKENEHKLFNEHKWREFRTVYRLVCHNSDKKSKTSSIYAKWVELFCKKVLNVNVKVVGGFANLYLDGNVPLPAHRDQYKKWIIGLSFGETRTLDFIPDDIESKKTSFTLESGDVFLFSPDVNNRYQHRMLAEPEKTKRRINITYFLEILPGEDEKKLLHQPALYKKNIPTFEEAKALYEFSLIK